MNAWAVVYVLAGAGAIVLIVGSIARDLATLWRVVMDSRVSGPPRPDPRPWVALALAVLVGLWIASAVLR